MRLAVARLVQTQHRRRLRKPGSPKKINESRTRKQRVAARSSYTPKLID